MKIILFTTFAACILLTGCLQTEGNLDIGGRVIDECTKEGLPNRKVIIQGFISSEKKLVDAGQFCTDSSGYFSYTLKKCKGAYSYCFLFVGDSAYSVSNQEVFLVDLEKNSKFLSFILNKLTNLTIWIDRCSTTPLCDTLYVSWKTDGIDGRNIYPHKVTNFGNSPDFEFRWTGGNIKSVIKTKVLSNRNTIICMELFRKGKKEEIPDTLYCKRDVDNSFSFKY